MRRCPKWTHFYSIKVEQNEFYSTIQTWLINILKLKLMNSTFILNNFRSVHNWLCFTHSVPRSPYH